jgi:Lipoxygenase
VRLRFFLYRATIAFFTWLAFRGQRVFPLVPPSAGAVRFRPYAAAFPGMPIGRIYDPEDFPPSDEAAPRLRRMKISRVLFGLADTLAPRTTAPVPQDEAGFLRIVYPFFFRRAWGRPPRTPRALLGPRADVVAEIAVRGPFASYLRRATEHDVRAGHATSTEQFALDLSWLLEYEVPPGLRRPGGLAVLDVRGGTLRTAAIHRRDGGARVDSPDYPRARAALLAGINEDLTTFRHNLATHLTTLTSFALASTNRLPPEHPVRRLLHHAFHTVLIGNREVAEFQLSGPGGFSARIFSHEAPVLARMADDYLSRFDVWDLEPPTQFARRGTTETPFDYPYRDNVMQVWHVTRDYVESYLRLYYGDDGAVQGDRALTAWLDELDRLVPNGVGRPVAGVTREWLGRLCAMLLHLSTAEHDVLNNVVWDYATIGWIIPTVAPESGAAMDGRRAFDLVATIIGTWKPYNMLLTADVPSLACDARGRAVMQEWIERLRDVHAKMPAAGERPDLSYPGNWNVSISN